MTEKDTINKLLESIDELIKIFSEDNTSGIAKKFWDFKDTHNSLYNKSKNILQNKLEVAKYNDINNFFHNLYKKSSFKSGAISGNEYKDILDKLIEYKKIISNIEFESENTEKKYKKIFYSWQSDLEKKYNTNFIEEIIKKLSKQFNLEYDESTRNTPGSPNIRTIILDKIREADIFICDITTIATKDNKEIPNPNVLFELGYATNCLGESNIIMIFNENYGNIDNLPFDIKGQKITRYKFNEDLKNKKTEIKNDLESKLKHNIEIIIKQK